MMMTTDQFQQLNRDNDVHDDGCRGVGVIDN